MLNEGIRILNLDGSLLKQRRLLSKYSPEIIDLKDLGPKARLWMNRRTAKEIENILGNSSRNSVTFMGSGDFHHISSILIRQFHEPICVIMFDLHPDWDTLPPRTGCGSWVNRALEKENIRKFILIGVSSDDISGRGLLSANLDSLKDDRVEIYPYAHKPSGVFFKRISENISFRFREYPFFSKIYWSELENKDLKDFLMPVLKRIATGKVYISIDKDCLKKDYALTNWEEGLMSLDELILMLRSIRENLDIIGADITGDYSRPSIQGGFKRICSYLDHPKKLAVDGLPEARITAVNEEANLKILRALLF